MKKFDVYFKDVRLNEEHLTEEEALEFVAKLNDVGIADLLVVDIDEEIAEE